MVYMRQIGPLIGRMADQRAVKRTLTTEDRKNKIVRSIYVSSEWRSLMKVIFASRGRKCQARNCPTPQGPWLSIYGHHIVELSDGGAPLDPSNVVLLCGPCHANITIENRRKREQRKQQSSTPTPNTIRFGCTAMHTTLVCGPPRAGKNTYVSTNMQHGDLVVDLDALWSALSAGATAEANFPFACEARDAVYRRIAQGSSKVGHRAWVIATAADPMQRRQLVSLVRAVEVVVLETPEATCLARLGTSLDPRPHSEMATAISRWWNEYRRNAGERVVGWVNRK
jgi:5-methylcytosine-specific restriction protein A